MIQVIAYDEKVRFNDKSPLTDELREFLVESLELTKKSLYLMVHNKHYETKKYCINQNYFAYKLRQIIYYVNTREILYFDRYLLTKDARKSLKGNLEIIIQSIKTEKTITIDRKLLASIQ
ncbi:hypothetical protein ACMGD3_13880 [Lysinibacillus sphaericus]|uniref:hypothetical protein n=1 Tax=Lysinibacillus sphaericus TaxID=1421 RepID=UPI003F7B1615